MKESRLEERPLRQRLLTGECFEISRELQNALIEVFQYTFDRQLAAVHVSKDCRKLNQGAALDGKVPPGVQQTARALNWLSLLTDGDAFEAVALGAGPGGLRVTREDFACRGIAFWLLEVKYSVTHNPLKTTTYSFSKKTKNFSHPRFFIDNLS